jgi:hypothetical protein
MHYKNGREAKNGDKVMLIPSYGAPVVGILYDATAGNDFCNGKIAPTSPSDPMPNLKECLHLDDPNGYANRLTGLTAGKDRHQSMPFVKLPAIKGSIACLTCGCGAHETFGMRDVIAVGFGSANVTKDGECVYDENQAMHFRQNLWTGADAEKAASADPDHDWRIRKIAPLYEAEYQRQGEKHWVLVSKGEGFA